ncbi:hypothetical protein AVEN_119345-1 [Araneus ventricosus]|uniref:Uncharacterized protein n=1 Tax=Araneus ventricosus TaxID=182803 RepID=A0A4Y2Q040_ARAVE|nr:hypothetical protein AVEN_119345-1 [Araneus ventricosus]
MTTISRHCWEPPGVTRALRQNGDGGALDGAFRSGTRWQVPVVLPCSKKGRRKVPRALTSKFLREILQGIVRVERSKARSGRHSGSCGVGTLGLLCRAKGSVSSLRRIQGHSPEEQSGFWLHLP